MLFNSYIFIFAFLPVTFFVYFFLNRKKLVLASKSWLVFSSLFFYSWWNVAYFPLILTSILFNYTLSNLMVNSDNQKKSLLLIGLVFNIGLLAYFKYMDFFIENINFVFDAKIELLHLALPLAISFFTLQQIAFLVDSYEGLVQEKKFLDYALFVTFFPQLIAGPIVHHKEMMPQFENLRNKIINYKNIAKGLFIFSIGLFKKVVIADTFAIWANGGFDKAETLNLLEGWATSLSYTFQMYFDFSGYMDMATGAALLFNIRLPQNFNSPYKATGIIDYWSRWHITLTNYLTTYVYTPILRSFKKITFNKAMIATFITFIISGIWHGASWMYVFWGGLHGIGVVINHYWKKSKIKMNKFLAWFITFNFVNITFIFFRAKDWDSAMKVLTSMFDFSNISLPSALKVKIGFLQEYGIEFNGFPDINIYFVYMLPVGFFLSLFFKNSIEQIEDFKFSCKNLVISTFSFFIAVISLTKISEFLYFNF